MELVLPAAGVSSPDLAPVAGTACSSVAAVGTGVESRRVMKLDAAEVPVTLGGWLVPISRYVSLVTSMASSMESLGLAAKTLARKGAKLVEKSESMPKLLRLSAGLRWELSCCTKAVMRSSLEQLSGADPPVREERFKGRGRGCLTDYSKGVTINLRVWTTSQACCGRSKGRALVTFS